MHAQIVTFHLDGLSDEDFRRECDEWAPAFTDVPGMIAKLWLADPATNTYAGVYTWHDRQAMLDYQQSELFQSVVADKRLAALSSIDFAVLEGPTRVTHGLDAVFA